MDVIGLPAREEVLEVFRRGVLDGREVSMVGVVRVIERLPGLF